jgi:hypothetical protein
MTFLAVYQAISKKFDDEVGSVLSNFAVAHDNAPFTPPAASGSRWCRFSVLPGESEVRELGATKARTTGIALASIFVQVELGDKLALDAADSVVTAFKEKSYTHSGTLVFFQTPSVTTVGREGAWFQINVSIPWYSDIS